MRVRGLQVGLRSRFQITLSRNLQIPLGPWHHQVYDRPLRAVVGTADSPLTPSRIEAMQPSELDCGAELGLVVRECPGTYRASSMAEIHSLGRVQLTFQCLQDR
jgi:hypothetical protein